MTEVRTRDEAIVLVDRALHMWSTNISAVLVQAQSVARGALNEVEGIERKLANKVAAIAALLAAADDRQRRQLEHNLVRAREEYEIARRARVRVNDVVASIAQLSRTHTTTAISQVSSAQAQLSAMNSAIDSYRSGAVALGGDGSSVGSTDRAGGVSLAVKGFADLDVNSADLDENPILDEDRGRGTFGKGGLSRADFRWAVQTWHDTVAPAVATGKTRDDFAERDALSNAQPLRRMADVYDMFLGTDRIRADRRPDGSLNIVNGRHRLLIARELGINSLPGQVT